MAWLYALNRCVMPAARLFIRGDIEGVEHIPITGPVLIAANHASFSDPWLVAMRAPQRSYRFVIVGRWFDRSPLWRSVFSAWGTIPTTPGAPEHSLHLVLEALEREEAVLIFPEGRISHDGRIGQGKRGIARLAALSGVPVLPLGLRGNFEFLPRNRRIPTWHPVSARVGPPLAYPGAPFPRVGPGVDGAGPEDLARYTASLMSEIARLAGQSSNRSAR